MEEKATDYTETLKIIINAIGKLFKNKKVWEREDEKITQLYDMLYSSAFEQIHNVLVPRETTESENEIRDIIRKYVIGGYCDPKTKVTYVGALNPILAKISQCNQKANVRREFLARYYELYDNFMSLAAFRSFKHFCLYMESVFGFTLWSDTQNCFNGYWYYASKMVLDGAVKFLEKQLPTGYGKSMSDCFMQAWLFGVDINNDVLKVCGNDKFTDDCFQNVRKIMLSPKYAKIFPYYNKFNCEENKMFTFGGRTELKFAITGAKKSTSLRIVTKLSDVNGVRAKYLFLDDITQRKDMFNMAMHEKDIHSFTHEWFERNYNRNLFYIIASGTTYSQFDILSHLKRIFGGETAQQSKINKYTSISYSDYIVKNGVSVFVCVPLLDYDTDESTYPKKIPTENARNKREENPAEFWAMDMQKPLPPETSPFYYTKLRAYETLPKAGENGRTDSCFASLDTKRRGKDYVSMPICFEANDPEHNGEMAHFVADWFYDNRTMKDCLPLICSKIVQHNITRLVVERNTEEMIAELITDELKKRGYTSCVIDTVYSTEQKDRRIMAAEGDIKSKMIFPKYGMYAPSSDFGKALISLWGYDYKTKVENDDAPDSCALYSKHFIAKKGDKWVKATPVFR